MSTRAVRAGRRGGTNLIALGSAAVLTVYAAGFARTKPAADRLAAASTERRPVVARPIAPISDPAVLQEPSKIAGGTQASLSAAVAPPVAAAIAQPTAAAPKVPKKLAARVIHDSSTKSAEGAESPTATGATTELPAPTSSAVSTTTVVAASPAVPATAPVATAVPAGTPASSATPATTDASATPAAPAKTVWRDGVFVGRGTSRHGDIEAMVEIKDGRIIGAVISQCLTRYSCSWVNHLLPQVVSRQSADVDYVSGATQSANALYYAVLQALTQAK
ncbi:MAG: FMN-binding protein [Gemmatimonas sp.]